MFGIVVAVVHGIVALVRPRTAAALEVVALRQPAATGSEAASRGAPAEARTVLR